MLIQKSYATLHYPEFDCKQHRHEDSFVKEKKPNQINKRTKTNSGETSNTALATFWLVGWLFLSMQLCTIKRSVNTGIDFMEYNIKSFLSYTSHINKRIINYFYKWRYRIDLNTVGPNSKKNYQPKI